MWSVWCTGSCFQYSPQWRVSSIRLEISSSHSTPRQRCWSCSTSLCPCLGAPGPCTGGGYTLSSAARSTRSTQCSTRSRRRAPTRPRCTSLGRRSALEASLSPQQSEEAGDLVNIKQNTDQDINTPECFVSPVTSQQLQPDWPEPVPGVEQGEVHGHQRGVQAGDQDGLGRALRWDDRPGDD